MNLKMIKSKTQENIVATIQRMVGEAVNVQCNYDFENEIVTILLLEEHKRDDVLEGLVIYNCRFNKEENALSVTGFARRFGYDAFGVAFINNEPITVDESFIHGIKSGITIGLGMPIEETPAPANAE